MTEDSEAKEVLMDSKWLAGMAAMKVRQMQHEEAGITRQKARQLAMFEKDGRSAEWVELELRCLQVVGALERMRILNVKE